jgi:sn-glycerol 3-phosphate transport system ATP-binding protein
VRPEHVRLSDNFGIPATVVAVEYLGADTIVTSQAGSEIIALRAAGRLRLAPGAAVRIAWAPDGAHLFDRASGKRRAGNVATARAARGDA